MLGLQAVGVALLSLKLLLVPLLVAAVTWLNGKVGPRIAGAVAGLPIVAGPAALVVALEQGPAFAEKAATSTLAGELSLAVFCVVYARSCATRPWWVSLGLGWAAFAACGLAVSVFDIDLAAALGLALLTPVLIARLSPRPASPPQRRKASLAELGLRMLAGATLVSVIASAAHVVGTRWSGLLTISPIATSVLAAGSQRSAGADQAVHLLRGLGAGLYSLTAFFAALALLIVRWGTPWAFGAAVLAALTAQLILLFVLD